MQRAAIQRQILEWYEPGARDLPWRATRHPYRTLVAEVMLQQTQTSRVAPIYRAFLRRFRTVRALANASTADVITAWRGLGYNRRAVMLHRAAKAIVRDFDSKIPDDLDALRSLPGIGEYTSSAVACFAFDHQVAVVDTNIRRVLARLGAGASELDAATLKRVALEWLPRGRAYEWNQALMDLGATICVSRSPRCDACPVRSACSYRADAPATSNRAEPFAGSSRQIRGRIIEALREAPRGLRTSHLADNGEDAARLARIVSGLERDGLVTVHRGRVRLPE